MALPAVDPENHLPDRIDEFRGCLCACFISHLAPLLAATATFRDPRESLITSAYFILTVMFAGN